MKLTVSKWSTNTSRCYFLAIASLLTLLTRSGISSAEKLSPDLKPPLYAQGAGGLRLEPPLEGPTKTYTPAILKETNRPNNGDGQYSFSFETEDGVQREETGTLKKVGDSLVTVVKGRYSYTSPEGLAIDFKYTADENGARSSFTFGTNPGKWKQSLLLPGFPNVTGKNKNSETTEGRDYLPPRSPVEKNNEYLPPRPPVEKNNEYLPPRPTAEKNNEYLPPPPRRKV